MWNPDDFEHVYDVGPGQVYSDHGQVPWESLGPSTLVRIYYRDMPYRIKWVVTTTATADKPLVIFGVADNGRLPVISGDSAVTRTSLYYLNEPRSVVKIGNYTGLDDTQQPRYIITSWQPPPAANIWPSPAATVRPSCRATGCPPAGA